LGFRPKGFKTIQKDWVVVIGEYDPPEGFLTLVGGHPFRANPNGGLEMAGNVLEWGNDLYNKSYYRQSPENDPGHPVQGAGCDMFL
jgi:hypothetical protein